MAIPKNMVASNQQIVSQIVTISKELLFVLFLLALVLVLKPVKADAASINVATGSSAINDEDSICQLEEAIGNINDGARTYVDCIETGVYGTDDTINLPVGTITGSGSSLSALYESATIVGQGRGVSVIDDGRLNLSGSGLTEFALQDFTMMNYGIQSNNVNMAIERVEIDLEGGDGPALYTSGGDVEIHDSYFHNAAMSGSGLYGLVLYSAMSSSGSLTVERTTLSHASKGINLIVGSGCDINATIKNTTFTDMHGNSGGAGSMGAGIFAYVDDSNLSSITYTTINNTFSNISNPTPGSYPAAAIAEFSEDGSITHVAQNDLYAVGDGSADQVNYHQMSGSGSGATFTTTSLGGNVSSDSSFSSELDQPTDKHNQTSLASFLGVLTDNGGEVPTLALQEGSPAIDAGTNVTGMTTDARGAARPQGSAFDAGAYEFASSNPEEDPDPTPESPRNTTTITNPSLKSPASSVAQFSNRPITVTTPTGTVITDSNTVPESSLAAQDADYQYPLGLVNFTMTTSQTDNQVILTFITDLKPNQVKPRKYNPDTKAYTDITNYTLTETTINGQHALVLTYTITDNGDLDLNKTTGVITDPVGLAVTNAMYDQLANTGQNSLLAAVVGGVMVLASGATLLMSKLKNKTKYILR